MRHKALLVGNDLVKLYGAHVYSNQSRGLVKNYSEVLQAVTNNGQTAKSCAHAFPGLQSPRLCQLHTIVVAPGETQWCQMTQ